jgi:hypothetical protein
MRIADDLVQSSCAGRFRFAVTMQKNQGLDCFRRA